MIMTSFNDIPSSSSIGGGGTEVDPNFMYKYCKEFSYNSSYDLLRATKEGVADLLWNDNITKYVIYIQEINAVKNGVKNFYVYGEKVESLCTITPENNDYTLYNNKTGKFRIYGYSAKDIVTAKQVLLNSVAKYDYFTLKAVVRVIGDMTSASKTITGDFKINITDFDIREIDSNVIYLNSISFTGLNASDIIISAFSDNE